MAERSERKVFGQAFFKKLAGCGTASHGLDLSGRQPKKKPATGADAPVRAIATGADSEAGALPSQSPNGASSPKGGAKARLPLWGRCHAKGMTERTAHQRPAHIRVPRRRLCQRAAHAWGGVTGELGGSLRGIEDAIKKPPARVSYGKQSTGLFSYFPALADATKTVGRCPTTRQLSFVESWAKNFTRLRRARALAVR